MRLRDSFKGKKLSEISWERIQDIKKIIAQTITGSTAKFGDPGSPDDPKNLYGGIGYTPAEYYGGRRLEWRPPNGQAA